MPRGSDKEITEQTREALRMFATPHVYGAPVTGGGENVGPGETDLDLVSHIVRATDVMRIDSANNEVLSCQLLQNDGWGNTAIGRDKAHGSRKTAHPHRPHLVPGTEPGGPRCRAKGHGHR